MRKDRNRAANPILKPLRRRDFLKVGAAAAGASVLPRLASDQVAWAAETPAPEKPVQIFWNSCNVNCGSRCALHVHVQDGKVVRIEPDQTGTDEYGQHQLRACPRGRSMRQRMYAPERLEYPMKRVGKRGEGKFERISWDEALDTVASELKRIKEKYGNEAIYLNYGTGALGSTMGKSWPPAATPVARLMNCYGGYLNHYSDYSTCQITIGLPYTYGGSWVDGNGLSDIVNSRLAVFFGNNPAETRMSGSKTKTLRYARDTADTRIIVIDPRYSDTVITAADEWIPIRPGADAALVSGLAYVMIIEDLVDKDFLARYCVGYDEDTLPAGIPGGSSYKSYILGKGPDGVAKTPGWASDVTGIPVERIVQLAREIAQAKPCYVAQGWGPQRHANGENTSRAIAMLPILTGNVGIRGGNTGARENGGYGLPMVDFPTLTNPVATTVSCFNWYEAIQDYTVMTADTHGVVGRDRLIAPIKFIWNYASNCLINQHAGANQMSKILEDTAKCEMIVSIDTTLAPSVRYADIVLPCALNLEENDWAHDADSDMGYVIFDQKCVEPHGESRGIYDICAGVAKRLDLEQEFTEGRTHDQWLQYLYAESRKNLPDLPPTLEDAFRVGMYKKKNPDGPAIMYKEFREDPHANPLDTPSGKIEIFSERLWNIAKDWKLPPGDKITALPEFQTTWEDRSDPLLAKYPLQLIGHHYKQRTHSTYGNCPWLKELSPQELWINPIDAGARKIKHGDKVRVFNDRGVSLVPAKVTPRIMPGCVSLPEGAWYAPNDKGEDTNGCVNALTALHPTALAKGNPQHTNLVEVQLA